MAIGLASRIGEITKCGKSFIFPIPKTVSRSVTGPYVDATGRPMLDGGGTQVLVGNQRWLGPGGESLYVGRDQTIMVFHAYDVETGRPALQVSTVGWKNGWPKVGLRDN